MGRAVLPLDVLKELDVADLNSQFFMQLSNQRFFRSFIALLFTPRELPLISEMSAVRVALTDKNLTLLIPNDSRNDPNHKSSLVQRH